MEVPSDLISAECELQSLSARDAAEPGTSKSPDDGRNEVGIMPVFEKSMQYEAVIGNVSLAEALPFYSLQPGIEFESPGYFSHLVKTHSTTQGLPKRYLDVLGDKKLESGDLWRPGNAFISQLKLFALLKNHMRLSLVREYEKILEASSVSNEQLDRVFAILKRHDECPVPKFPSSLINSSASKGLEISNSELPDSGDRAMAPLSFEDMLFSDFTEIVEQRHSQKPELNPERDEYAPRAYNEAGEQKVMATGQLLEGRVYRFRTFSLPDRGEKLFALANECAQVLGYRDSDQIFDRHRSLFKVIATEAEKEYLIDKEILPGHFDNPEIAILTAYSIFRVFGCEAVVNGKFIQDDYWEIDSGARDSIEEPSSREIGSDTRDPGPTDFRLFPSPRTSRHRHVKWVKGLHSSRTTISRGRSTTGENSSAQLDLRSHAPPTLRNPENPLSTWKDALYAFTSFILPKRPSAKLPTNFSDIEAQEDTDWVPPPPEQFIASPPIEPVPPGPPRPRFERLAKIFTVITTPLPLREVFSTPQAEQEFFRERKITAYKRIHGFPLRFMTAFLGGLALIVPMLIMAINQNRTKSLVTASVCVLLFALGLAWAAPATPQELLGATAAYAAVLVVFVGVSS